MLIGSPMHRKEPKSRAKAVQLRDTSMHPPRHGRAMICKLTTIWRIGVLGAVAGLLAACAATGGSALPAAGQAPAGGSPEAQAPREAEPAPALPAGPVTPAAQQQAHKTALGAASLLETGNEEQAKSELQRALALDPNSKLALSLMRQISADPVATLGRDSYGYTVRAGDSLSGIAERHLGDKYLFYLLARYNDIKVPRQVAGGQTLRIPGKAPPPETRSPVKPEPPPEAKKDPPTAPVAAVPVATRPTAPPEPTPGERALRNAEAAESGGDLERALSEYRRAASLDAPADKAAPLQKRLADRFAGKARGAFAKQDLDGSIRNWERVLELQPANDTARLERQRAIALKEKVKKLPN
jgi:tetratricopeptide (TPR) repeat protein